MPPLQMAQAEQPKFCFKCRNKHILSDPCLSIPGSSNAKSSKHARRFKSSRKGTTVKYSMHAKNDELPHEETTVGSSSQHNEEDIIFLDRPTPTPNIFETADHDEVFHLSAKIAFNVIKEGDHEDKDITKPLHVPENKGLTFVPIRFNNQRSIRSH